MKNQPNQALLDWHNQNQTTKFKDTQRALKKYYARLGGTTAFIAGLDAIAKLG